MVKPARLKPGDTIGLVALATRIQPEEISGPVGYLEKIGFRVKLGKHLTSYYGYLAGTDSQRVCDLEDMFEDPEVDAVFCAKGGYGTPRIVDKINYDVIQKNPKILAGYSDITGLHVALERKTDLITFHAPMVCSDIPNKFSELAMLDALMKPVPLGKIPESDSLKRKAIFPGKASGRLIGGNLSLLVSTLGSPYEIDTRGKILLIEDVGESPYRIDRMFASMRLAGKFDDAAGIAFGAFRDCVPEIGEQEPTQSVDDLILDYFGGAGKPVLSGLPFGHISDNWTLPLGAQAILDSENQSLEITESAVS